MYTYIHRHIYIHISFSLFIYVYIYIHIYIYKHVRVRVCVQEIHNCILSTWLSTWSSTCMPQVPVYFPLGLWRLVCFACLPGVSHTAATIRTRCPSACLRGVHLPVVAPSRRRLVYPCPLVVFLPSLSVFVSFQHRSCLPDCLPVCLPNVYLIVYLSSKAIRMFRVSTMSSWLFTWVA